MYSAIKIVSLNIADKCLFLPFSCVKKCVTKKIIEHAYWTSILWDNLLSTNSFSQPLYTLRNIWWERERELELHAKMHYQLGCHGDSGRSGCAITGVCIWMWQPVSCSCLWGDGWMQTDNLMTLSWGVVWPVCEIRTVNSCMIWRHRGIKLAGELQTGPVLLQRHEVKHSFCFLVTCTIAVQEMRGIARNQVLHVSIPTCTWIGYCYHMLLFLMTYFINM